VRYWLLKDDRVLGPFGAEELGSRPDLHPGALLCPESPSEAPTMEQWVRAESMPELAALLKDRAALPPDEVYTPSRPVFLDHPVLVAILRKVEDLERSINESQMKATERERDIAELKDLLAIKEASETGLKDTVRSLVEKTARMNEVLTELAELRRQVKENSLMKAAAFDALRSGVEELRAEAAAAKDERGSIRERLGSLEDELRGETGSMKEGRAPEAPKDEAFPAEEAGVPKAAEGVLGSEAGTESGLSEPSPDPEPEVPGLPLLPEPAKEEESGGAELPPEPEAEAMSEAGEYPPPPDTPPEPPPVFAEAPASGLSRRLKVAGALLAALLGIALAYWLNQAPEPARSEPALEAPVLPEPEPAKPPEVKAPSKKKAVKKKRQRPRRGKRRPSKKAVKPKEPTPEEKEAAVKRKIINNLKLRLSGGRISAGKETVPAGAKER